MPRCFFAADLHGRFSRYETLLAVTRAERPDALFLGGDLLPSMGSALTGGPGGAEFVDTWLAPRVRALSQELGEEGPRIFVVPGNDDPRAELGGLERGAEEGLWELAHGRRLTFRGHVVLGYACVPPTPFPLKDWERYDVSRFVDPGCVSPEEGRRSVAVEPRDARWSTIAADLEALAGEASLERAILLFHAPPHGTALDRAALDGKTIEHVPLDVHVGSIAIRRFLFARQPAVSLHGHVHESVRLTGRFKERLGRTWALGAAHDGDELCLVRFDPAEPGAATRELL
jgi:Icc-related predicted phosphoesterase